MTVYFIFHLVFFSVLHYVEHLEQPKHNKNDDINNNKKRESWDLIKKIWNIYGKNVSNMI